MQGQQVKPGIIKIQKNNRGQFRTVEILSNGWIGRSMCFVTLKRARIEKHYWEEEFRESYGEWEDVPDEEA